MKIILAVLSIALVAQVSNAAYTQRSKRDAAAQKDSYQLVKQLSAEIKSLAEAVLKDIPSSDTYSKHKEDWVNFLKLYDETFEICVDKLNTIIQKFSELTEKYVADSASKEEDEMFKLVVKHGLLPVFEKFVGIFETAKDPENILDIFEEC